MCLLSYLATSSFSFSCRHQGWALVSCVFCVDHGVFLFCFAVVRPHPFLVVPCHLSPTSGGIGESEPFPASVYCLIVSLLLSCFRAQLPSGSGTFGVKLLDKFDP